MNLYNPYDYGSRLDRGLATEEEAESFGLSGAFWFVFTTMQWQGQSIPARTMHWLHVDPMLGQRRRRWANIGSI